MFKKKKTTRSLGGDIAFLIFLTVVGLFFFMPFIYSIVQSLKPPEEIFVFPPRLTVDNPTLDNFSELFRLSNELWVPFGRYLLNSVFVSFAATALHVIVASMAAFALAKYKFPLSKFLFEIVVLALLFTGDVINVMRYLVMAKIGLIDTLFSVILPAISAPLGLFLMTQFMRGIPDSLLEAAKIDGAGTFTILWRIVMTNVKPAWMTLIIFSFQGLWNSTGGNYIYSESQKLLPTVFNQISAGGIARAGVAAAAAVVMIILPVVMFLFAQGSIIETMTQSGIKE